MVFIRFLQGVPRSIHYAHIHRRSFPALGDGQGNSHALRHAVGNVHIDLVNPGQARREARVGDGQG